MSDIQKTGKTPLIRLVVAASENNVIGKDNTLIWHLPADLKRFKEVTLGAPIIMGRKTFESIGRPLPGRRNIVITRDASYYKDGIETVASPDEAIQVCAQEERVSIIGGGEIYKMFLDMANEVYLTRVHTHFEGDTYFPQLGSEWEKVSQEDYTPDEKNKFPFSFILYRKKGI